MRLIDFDENLIHGIDKYYLAVNGMLIGELNAPSALNNGLTNLGVYGNYEILKYEFSSDYDIKSLIIYV